MSSAKLDIIKGVDRPSHRGLLTPNLLLVLLLLLAALPSARLPGALPRDCWVALTGQTGATSPPVDAAEAAAVCFPLRAELWEEAARQALQAGQPALAISYLESALANSNRFSLELQTPADNSALILLADAYLQAGEAARALEVWETIARRSGLSADTARALASLHLAQADYPAARQTWETLLAQHPGDAQAHFELGLLLAAYDPEAALPHLAQAADLDPQFVGQTEVLQRAILGARIGSSAAYTLLASGRVLATLGHWGLAAEAFRQSILHQPNYAEAWAYLGEARQHLQTHGETSQAAGAPASDGLFELQTALELNPRSLSAWTFVSLYWQRRSEPERALEAAQRASEFDPANPVLQAHVASIQAEAGDFDAAFASYQQAARLAPYDPAYLRQIVLFALDYNYRVEQTALPISRQLLIDHPQDPLNLDLMGRTLIYLGDLAGAQKFLVRALQIDPRSAPAHLHLGLLYLLQQDPTAALDHLQAAQALDPAGPSGSQARRLLENGAP
ncbi:MAG: hypothetical protein B6D39_01680 [Anaerolineae bacterium UTCFX2]|nr:MAG: hypothetical protein B6D39_01680 [Anaerolineae bacterium UTCFX2]